MGTLSSGRMVIHIASAKITECEKSISPSGFYGQLHEYQAQVFSLIYPVHEFFLKEMRTWGQSKILFYCFCFWCESRELGGRESSMFPCVTPVVKTFSERITFKILSKSCAKTANALNTLIVSTEKLHCRPSTRF